MNELERQQVIDEYNRDRMSKLGRSRSPAKREAARKNIEKALRKRWGRPIKVGK